MDIQALTEAINRKVDSLLEHNASDYVGGKAAAYIDVLYLIEEMQQPEPTGLIAHLVTDIERAIEHHTKHTFSSTEGETYRRGLVDGMKHVLRKVEEMQQKAQGATPAPQPDWIYAEYIQQGDVIEIMQMDENQVYVPLRISVGRVERKRSGIHLDVVVNGNYCFWDGDRVKLISREPQPARTLSDAQRFEASL